MGVGLKSSRYYQKVSSIACYATLGLSYYILPCVSYF
jgi:hypothetical protein